MNVSKKLSLILLGAAVLLGAAIYLIVSAGDRDVYTAIDARDPVLGQWQAPASGESPDIQLRFSLPEDDPSSTEAGQVSGQIEGIHLIDATFQKKDDDSYVIINREGRKSFVLKIDADQMILESAATTYDSRWTLSRQ